MCKRAQQLWEMMDLRIGACSLMKKTILLPMIAVGLLAVLVNLETIRTFPSWFDEAFMANVSFNLAQGKNLILDLIPEYYTKEVNLYGPIYFYLQAFLIDSFGLQAFIFRLPNLLAGYVSVLLLAMVLRHMRQIIGAYYMLLIPLAWQ